MDNLQNINIILQFGNIDLKVLILELIEQECINQFLVKDLFND